MQIVWGGVPLPVQSKGFVVDALRSGYGVQNTGFTVGHIPQPYYISLHGTTDVNAPFGLSGSIGNSFLYLDGGTFGDLLKALSPVGYAKLLLIDDDFSIQLGNVFPAYVRLVKDGPFERERVWQVMLGNANRTWPNNYTVPASPTLRQCVDPRYLRDEPESWLSNARLSTLSTASSGSRVPGLLFPKRLAYDSATKTYSYGAPASTRSATAHNILDKMADLWGGRVISGAILSTADAANLIWQESITRVVTSRVDPGSVVTTAVSSKVNLRDVYPEANSFSDVGRNGSSSIFNTNPTSAPECPSPTTAAAFGLALARNDFEWRCAFRRIQGNSIHNFTLNTVTFAGFVPWEMSGVEADVSWCAGMDDLLTPCTVVTSVSSFGDGFTTKTPLSTLIS